MTCSFSLAGSRPWSRPTRYGARALLRIFEFLGDRLDAGLAGILDARINDVGLAALGHLVADEGPDLGQAVARADEGLDAPAPGWQLVNDRDVQLAIEGQAERARDGGGGHDQQMRVAALAHELLALRHAELVLLVNDHQAEVGQLEAGSEQGVGADEEGRGLRVEGCELRGA